MKISGKIGLDINDTTWDLVGAWLHKYNQITGENIYVEQIRGWDIASYVNDKKLLFEILFQEELWDSVLPLEDSQRYIKQLCKDYEVYMITASHPDTVPLKCKRFTKLYPFVDPNNIIIAYNKQIIDVDLLVDDNPQNLINGHYNKILNNKPWNEDLNTVEYGILRANNWDEIYKNIHTLLPTE